MAVGQRIRLLPIVASWCLPGSVIGASVTTKGPRCVPGFADDSAASEDEQGAMIASRTTETPPSLPRPAR
jgi:hypothetical protein